MVLTVSPEAILTNETMSPRVRRLRARMLDGFWEKKTWWGHDLHVSDDPAFYEQPLIVRKALSIQAVLTRMPARVPADQLILGDIPMGSIGMGRIFPDYATHEESETAKKHILSIKSVYGHSIPDHADVLTRGLGQIKQDARDKREALDGSDLNASQRDFLYAVEVSCDAVIQMANQYGDLADRAALAEDDIERRQELERIARACRHVPEHPARNFHEACQSFWFTHMALHSTLDYTPIGRLDQFLYPFFAKDFAAKTLSLQDAQELIYCLWLKFNERTQVDPDLFEDHVEFGEYSLGGALPHVDKTGGALHWLQEVMVGGQTPDGKDATNELTFMCLEATQQLELTNPCCNVRFFRESPPELLRKAVEVVRSGGGMPPMFNDEVIVPALVNMGIPVEEARDYAADGCWEVLIPGRTEFRYGEIHFLKAVEWAINRGCSVETGIQESIDTGDPLSFTSFDQLLEAFKHQLRDYINVVMRIALDNYGKVALIAPTPLMSALLKDCVSAGKDMTQGGARYIVQAPLGNGVSNAADSLFAIKQFVYDRKEVSLQELIDALRHNWEGAEHLREKFMFDAPKFGNDSDEVDAFLAQLIEVYLECIDTYREEAWQRHRMLISTGVGTFERYKVLGSYVGATPDGRRHGQWISPNLSPTVGMDRTGALNAVRSYTKFDLSRFPCGSVLDLKFVGGPLQSEDGLEAAMSVVQEFLDRGGNILTITVADAKLFRQAQEHPRDYTTLRVRMGGWQGYFVALDAEHQAHHISRAEHYVGGGNVQDSR